MTPNNKTKPEDKNLSGIFFDICPDTGCIRDVYIYAMDDQREKVILGALERISKIISEYSETALTERRKAK